MESVNVAAEETLLFSLVLREMTTLLTITGFALLIMETLVGIIANGFIVLISCIEGIRSRKLSPTDLILICLGSSRLMWQVLEMLHVTMFYFFLHPYILKQVHFRIVIVWFFTDTVSLWFAACLSVWYLTKIAVFSHPVFLQVKQRISGLLPWLLLGSVVISALMDMTMTVITVSSSDVICDPYKLLLNNSFGSETQNPQSCMDLLFLHTVSAAIPSVIFLSSTILLIISLWKHTRHLQHNRIGVRDLNTNVHLSAIKALVSFAILYLSSLVATNVQKVLFWRSNDGSWTSVLYHNVCAAYPSVHAIVLILINPKLKQAWVRMIHHLKCRVSKAPS